MLVGYGNFLSFVYEVRIYIYMRIVGSQKSCIIYVQFKLQVIESTCLTKPTPKNTVSDTEPKVGIGLGSHKKLVPTPEPENSNQNSITQF